MRDSDGLRALQRRFHAERPHFTGVAGAVEQRMRNELARAGIQAVCSSRAKEVDSFIKKAMKDKYTDPWNEIRDKAAARIVLFYRDDLEQVKGLIESAFTILHREDKNAVYEQKPDLLGYRGFHYEVLLAESTDAATDNVEYDASRHVCEIQVQSRAQNLWNDASHTYLYKSAGKASSAIQRRIYRLVALMELFDEELCRARSEAAAEPGSDTARLLLELEKQFLQMSPRHFDEELSIEVLEALQPLLTAEEKQRFPDLMSSFVANHADKLLELYEDYRANDDRHPLIFQPETLLIFERFGHDRFALRERWESAFPPSLLEDLATIWGVRIS